MKIIDKKEKNSDFDTLKDTVFKSPITKVVLIGMGVLAFVGISGYVFKLINFTVGNYKELTQTIKRP